MSRTTIMRDGAVVFRTKLFTSSKSAQAFARCVAGNASRFCDVMVHQSDRAKTPKFFVTFRPVSAARQADAYMQEWNKNERRADEQGGDFIYWQAPDDTRKSWVFNPHSGETYVMWTGHCTCPQKEFRLNRAAMPVPSANP